MIESIDSLTTVDSLGQLVADLRGLYVEADPHDPRIRVDFEMHWSAVDAEHELRTERWAPTGAASDERLARAVASFRSWVLGVLTADQSDQHC
jgi:hypothetical protein